MLINDILIDCCLRSGEQYFINIHDGEKSVNNKLGKNVAL